MTAREKTTTTRPRMAFFVGLLCDAGTSSPSLLMLVMTVVLAAIFCPQGMMAEGVDVGAVGARVDAQSVGTRTLNAFARALQLSEVPALQQNEPPTAPPTRFRFENIKPHDRSSSRITFIPEDRGERRNSALLPFPGASLASTSLGSTQAPTKQEPVLNTRFTTPGPKNSKPSKDNTFSDDYYYDYYDYYYDDNETNSNAPIVNLGPLDPPNQPKELVPYSTELSTKATDSTTAKPFRFSSFSDTNDRPTRRPTLPSRREPPSKGTGAAGRYSSLSELIANLKGQVQGGPDSPPVKNDFNVSNNNRDARVLLANSERESKHSDSKNREIENDIDVRVTTSTESSVVVASVQTSHSVSVSEGFGPTTNVPPPFLSSTSEAQETTAEPSLTTTANTASDIPRQLKRLDDFFPNLNSDVTNAEKGVKSSHDLLTPVEKPRLETLFNIEIDTKNQTVTATDAKLDSIFDTENIADISEFLPSGYNITEENQESTSPSTTSSTTTAKSNLESLIETTLLSNISSVLPDDYQPTEEQPEPQTSTENSPQSITEKPNLFELFSAIQTTTDSFTSEVSIGGLFDNVKQVDFASFLPPGYKPTVDVSPVGESSTDNAPTSEQPSALSPTKKIPLVKTVDPLSFLPPDYKLSPETSSDSTTKKIPVLHTPDISAFLPPGYKLTEEPPTERSTKKAPVIQFVDNLDFLPPGFKASEEPDIENTTEQVIIAQTPDISAFLPPGYKLSTEPNEEDISSSTSSSTSTTDSTTTESVPKGLVFPRRPDRPSFLTTPKPIARTPSGPPPLKPTFKNIWDSVRTTTEFTGWSFSTEATPKGSESGSASEDKDTTTTSTTSTTTTTTTTTTTSPRPTTPGVCGEKCRLAATLRIIDGTEWRPELANRDTLEWQELANTVEIELDSLYRRSILAPWYERVEIDAFNPGSVLVDYILHLTDLSRTYDTTDLKEIVNKETSENEGFFLGNYTLDPAATDFIVMHEKERLREGDDDNGYLIPQWLIAVIVIGLASLLFILIFGITVYVNRTCCNVVKPSNVPLTEEMLNECDLVNRARVKKRHDVPLTAEMLNELNKAHMAGVDNYAMDGLYDMDAIWNEKMHDRRVMKPPSSKGRGYNPNYNINIYDSWRTDWSGPYGSSATYAKRRPDTNF